MGKIKKFMCSLEWKFPEFFNTCDLGTLNEINLDLIDFPAFESQGRVWLLFWQTDDFRLVKQQVFKQNAFRVRTIFQNSPNFHL